MRPIHRCTSVEPKQGAAGLVKAPPRGLGRSIAAQGCGKVLPRLRGPARLHCAAGDDHRGSPRVLAVGRGAKDAGVDHHRAGGVLPLVVVDQHGTRGQLVGGVGLGGAHLRPLAALAGALAAALQDIQAGETPRYEILQHQFYFRTPPPLLSPLPLPQYSDVTKNW